MKQKLLILFITLLAVFTISKTTVAQNSLLVNLGGATCGGGTTDAIFSFIKDPLGADPSALITCSLDSELLSYYGAFIAYNPANNKIYVASTGTETNIYVLDPGLPANISCPSHSSIPDYSYSYISNNFEFDNNGTLWSLSNYVASIGQCNIDQFDVTSGTILSTRLVQFPANHFPQSISSGDVSILPNGRMFAVLGTPSILYEINNYNTTTNATATYLDSMPQSCFGIAYLNGQLELTGFASNCYYYTYNIATQTLDSTANSSQVGQIPIDNTSISPSVGVTKQLLNATKVNNNTADLTYDIYVRNLGNVALNDINVSDNLAAVYGAGNISNVTASFDAVGDAANLVLNTDFNGSSDTNLLVAGQDLANQVLLDTNYFFKIKVALQVTNLDFSTVYLNSAIGSATIGSVAGLTSINVSDSSNNGPPSVVDPNNDGNPGEPGENVPTPFSFSSLPVKFINVSASFIDKTSAMVQWNVAAPLVNADHFVIEYSADGRNFKSVGTLKITNSTQGSYKFVHENIPSGNLYYRIMEVDKDGSYNYSNTVLLTTKNSGGFIVFPNPANSSVTITAPSNTDKAQVILYDVAGRQLTSINLNGVAEEINTSSLPNGTYLLKMINNGAVTTQKIIVMHK